MEKLVPTEQSPSSPASHGSSGEVTSAMENLTTDSNMEPEVVMEGPSDMEIVGGTEEKKTNPSLQCQIKQIKPLLSGSSRLGRALAELFGLLVKLCVGSPLRQRRGQVNQPSPAMPSPPARAVATALTKLLTSGLSWEPPPTSPLPKFRLTFFICSVGFTSPMLFDEKKFPYHLMLMKFLSSGGQHAFFNTFNWAITLGNSVPAEDGLESSSLPDGTGEFLDGLENCQKLSLVDLSANSLTSLGSLQEHKLEHLAEVVAKQNKIESLSHEIPDNWPVIKKLDLAQNCLKEDMESEDYEFYKGLDFLLENKVADLGYDQTFSTEIQEFGVTEVRDLIPDGRNVIVTDQNKADYIRLVCQMKMTGAIRKQLAAFLEGFYDIIPRRLIAIFNEQELELLLSGLPDINIDDLKANSEYHKYSVTSLQIVWFWRALRSFDQTDRAKFLQFVTGSSKVPLQGFGALEGMNGAQKFQIHRDDRSTDRLPAAHTCFNQLDLPAYETYDKLRTYLLKAIQECSEGFGFA